MPDELRVPLLACSAVFLSTLDNNFTLNLVIVSTQRLVNKYKLIQIQGVQTEILQ